MAKNKYDFIKELIEEKKINQNQRERIIELATREISIEGTLEERVQKIEEIVFKNTIESHTKIEVDISTDLSLPKYLDPYYLYKFLFEYNQNPVLRSTCHDIDSEEMKKINEYCNSNSYNFKMHLLKITESFDLLEKKYPAPKQVKGLIRGYLTGKDWFGNQIKDGWSTDGIEISWSSIKLDDWANKNPNVPPNLNEEIAGNMKIELLEVDQINSTISVELVQNFTQLVLHFKNLFHLKSGSQSLRSILNRVNAIQNWNEKVEFEIYDKEFPNNLEHFTHVDSLVQTYNKFLKLIIDHHQGDDRPRVKLRFYEENHRVYLSIHHLNGQYNKTLQNCIDRPRGRDYKNLIRFHINGLCNMYLKADFGNQEFAAINLWDGRKLEANKLDKFTGVEHVLEFPKTKRS
jgi:hypothetical protein